MKSTVLKYLFISVHLIIALEIIYFYPKGLIEKDMIFAFATIGIGFSSFVYIIFTKAVDVTRESAYQFISVSLVWSFSLSLILILKAYSTDTVFDDSKIYRYFFAGIEGLMVLLMGFLVPKAFPKCADSG